MDTIKKDIELSLLFVPPFKGGGMEIFMENDTIHLLKECDAGAKMAISSIDEIPDFIKIKGELEKMALAIDSLNLWINHTIASGKIDKNLLEKNLSY